MKATKWKGRFLGKSGPQGLFLFFARFFPAAFARQRFLGTLFLAGFQVEGVALDLLDDVFLLHLALETPQGVF